MELLLFNIKLAEFQNY